MNETKDMIAVTSLLDPEHTAKVNELIDTLEERFGLATVKTTPYPHVTWLTTEDCALVPLKEALFELAEASHPFSIQTTGIGIFPGPKPVIYIPVVRTHPLNQYHERLYDKVSGLGGEIVGVYHPERWVPHITLALGDTSPALACQVVEFLIQKTFNWEIPLDNLALLTKSGDKFLKEEVYMLNTELV